MPSFTLGAARRLGAKASSSVTASRPAPDSGLGDLNQNGEVDAEDLRRVQLYLQGQYDLTPEERARADVNGDGQVTEVDATHIEGYINGSSTFPGQ